MLQPKSRWRKLDQIPTVDLVLNQYNSYSNLVTSPLGSQLGDSPMEKNPPIWQQWIITSCGSLDQWCWNQPPAPSKFPQPFPTAIAAIVICTHLSPNLFFESHCTPITWLHNVFISIPPPSSSPFLPRPTPTQPNPPPLPYSSTSTYKSNYHHTIVF